MKLSPPLVDLLTSMVRAKNPSADYMTVYESTRFQGRYIAGWIGSCFVEVATEEGSQLYGELCSVKNPDFVVLRSDFWKLSVSKELESVPCCRRCGVPEEKHP